MNVNIAWLAAYKKNTECNSTFNISKIALQINVLNQTETHLH